jgi:signal transduction histidine kinase
VATAMSLNKAFAQVREAEAQAFYDLFRAELEAQGLAPLLRQFLVNLTRVSQAQAGRLVLFEPGTGVCIAQAEVGAEGDEPAAVTKLPAAMLRKLGRTRYILRGTPGTRAILDRRMAGKFRSFWSKPVMHKGQLAGVIQLGFSTERSWLPREVQLLDAAVDQCLLAAEKVRLMEDLATREDQVRQLSERIWQVEEEERRRISRELHDEAGQSMLFIRLQLEMLEAACGEGEIPDRLREIRDVTEKTIVEIRRVIAALSPAVLEQLGLSAALRQLTSRFRRLHPARIRLHISPKINRLPRQHEVMMYRLVQECYNNIAKHSSASAVNISLTSSDNYLELRVEDDGVGFQVEEAFEKRHSFGLPGMRERVALLGGRFVVASAPNQGTKITIQLPLERDLERETQGGAGGRLPMETKRKKPRRLSAQAPARGSKDTRNGKDSHSFNG